MPFAKYYQVRTKTRGVTGADAVDLFSSSTVTVGPFPPHPHVHVHKEGFIHAPLTAKQLADKRSLAGDKRLGPKGVARLQTYKQRGYLNNEGLHIDPAKRAMMDVNRQIHDPVGKARYIDRKKHSQFEDAEIAIMALVHTLNTVAGEKAMAWLTADGKRVTIVSKSAAAGLNAGPLPYKNPPKAPSAHPLTGKTPVIIERGVGASGAAVLIQAKIGSVVSTFQCGPNDEITLVTHYPQQLAPLLDDLQFKDYKNIGKKYPNVPCPPTAPIAPVNITWSHPQPIIGTSGLAGIPCVVCATTHGRWTSSRFNPWYRCSRCGDVYCPVHGQALVAGPTPADPHARNCRRAGCGGKTYYDY
jgi:hypothetical protein